MRYGGTETASDVYIVTGTSSIGLTGFGTLRIFLRLAMWKQQIWNALPVAVGVLSGLAPDFPSRPREPLRTSYQRTGIYFVYIVPVLSWS